MNFKQILEEHRVVLAPAHHTHSREGWVQFDCPYCGAGSRKFHMGLNTSNGVVNCWKCGQHRLLDVLCLLTGMKRGTALELVRGIPRAAKAHTGRPRGRLVQPQGLQPLGGPHKRYLQARGIQPAYAAKVWGVQGIGIASRLAWRLWLPITLDGEVVSWTTRALGNSPHRYIAAPASDEAVPGKDVLAGADLCRHACIIVEGYLDAVLLGPGSAATCGTAYTTAQVRQAAAFNRRVICFDSSPDAQARAGRLADALSAFPGETHSVLLETGKDPGEADPAEVDELRAWALGPGTEWARPAE